MLRIKQLRCSGCAFFIWCNFWQYSCLKSPIVTFYMASKMPKKNSSLIF